jgi:hypothetical protein
VSAALEPPRLLKKQFVKLFALFGVSLFAEVLHLDKLDLVGAGHRRVNTFSVHELSGFSHDAHAFFVKKKIDDALAAFGCGAL